MQAKFVTILILNIGLITKNSKGNKLLILVINYNKRLSTKMKIILPLN